MSKMLLLNRNPMLRPKYNVLSSLKNPNTLKKEVIRHITDGMEVYSSNSDEE